MTGRKPKLCLISTGGTIGMVRGDDGLAHPPEEAEDSEAMLAPLRERYDIGVVSFPPRDSTDLTPSDWNKVRLEVEGLRDEGVEGFVVTHGTDTMAYAAATLAFLLGPPPLPQPVVLTGAQRTPDAEDYDGACNLADACAVAASDLGEVAVVFHGRVLRGCRVEKASLDDLDAFRSPEVHGLGRVADGGAVGLHDDAARRGAQPAKPWESGLSPAVGVLSVALSPGLNPRPYLDALQELDHYNGVILHGYGAGHIPGRNTSDWVGVIREANEHGIPVLVTSPLASGRASTSDYAVGQAAIDAGGIPAHGMVKPAAEMKFRLLIAAADLQDRPRVEFVRDQMATSHFGELGGAPQGTSTGV